MKFCGLFLALATLAVFLRALPVTADTIFQTNSQGKQTVVQREAIVLKDDPNFVFYKHFDLKERRVVKVSLNKGSLPFQVVRSAEAQRQDIVGNWKRYGYTATVTDQAGKTTQLYDAFLDFYPPEGRGSLLESVPPRTNFPLTAGGVPDEVDFDKIARIDFQGGVMNITLRDGHTETGKFLMPTNHPAEARIMGITDKYDPASPEVFDFGLALDKIKSIQFATE